MGPAVLLCLLHQAVLSSIALVSSPLAVLNKGLGQFSGFRFSRISSPTSIPSGPVLLCWPGTVQRLLFLALQLISVRYCSPAFMTPGQALSPASGVDGRGMGWHLFPAHAPTWQMSNGDSSSFLTSGWLTHGCTNRVSSIGTIVLFIYK